MDRRVTDTLRSQRQQTLCDGDTCTEVLLAYTRRAAITLSAATSFAASAGDE